MGELINFPGKRHEQAQPAKPEMIEVPDDMKADAEAARRRRAMRAMADLIDEVPKWEKDN